MLIFETLLAVLLGAVLLSMVAVRIRAPYPALLALGGFAAAFLPFVPEVTVDPELALVLFVAPVLLDAAFDSSPRDLKRNVVPIAFLGVATVAVTTAAVAWIAKTLLPDMPWAAAVALGAAVAPPDAIAATQVLRTLPVPHRVKTILEGEGLFNDATALVTYRIAVGAVAGGFAFGWPLIWQLALATVGSAAFAAAAAWVLARLVPRIKDAPSAILVQFITAFGLWIAAEALSLSGIITVVVYSLVIARMAASRTSAIVRVPTYAVWETVVFGLNALAFALIGLQIAPILERLEEGELSRFLLFALAVTAVAIGVRMAWVMGYNLLVRLKNAVFGVNAPAGQSPPTFKTGVVIGWAGMRGIITLAAVFALPSGFPERDLIVFTAFVVVLITLVVQGMTLGPLIKMLGLTDDGEVAREIDLARTTVARAALEELKDETGRDAVRLRETYQERLDAMGALEDGERPEISQDTLHGRVLDSKRKALLALLDSGEIGDDAYYQLEEELDRQELSLAPVVR